MALEKMATSTALLVILACATGFRPPQRGAQSARAPRSLARPATARDVADAASDVAERLARFDPPALAAAVSRNLGDGAAGERGEALVAAQFAILGLIAFADALPGARLLLLGAGALALPAALLLVVGGVLALEDDLTPFPAPTRANALRTDGVYALVRHPIYGGALVGCGALAALTGSAPRFALTLALLGVLQRKVAVEDAALRERHGEAHREYVARVPAALVPGFFD